VLRIGLEAAPELPDLPVYDLLAIAVCLLASAFFSSAETALTSLAESRVRQLQDEFPHLRKRFQTWLDNAPRLIATLLVGNNVVNIAASVLGARVARRYLDSWADAVAVGTMTLVILTFGEVIPKTFAKRAATFWAPRVIRGVCFLDTVLHPLSWVFSRIGHSLADRAENAGVPSEPSVTEGELQHMIDIGEREGVLGADHGDMLRAVLEFEDTLVKEVMVPRTEIQAVPIDSPLQEVLAIVNSSGHSRLPVYRGQIDNIIGMLHVKDLLPHLGTGDACSNFDWKAHVRAAPKAVPETQKLSALLRQMKIRREHMAIVVDEFGGTSGLVTLEDVLEEIVGEIQDEYDAEEPLVREESDGRFVADARVPLRDLGEKLGVAFPDAGDYETLGGFVAHLFGRLPERGARIEWESLALTVRDADARRVRFVEIRRVAPPSGEAGAAESADRE